MPISLTALNAVDSREFHCGTLNVEVKGCGAEKGQESKRIHDGCTERRVNENANADSHVNAQALPSKVIQSRQKARRPDRKAITWDEFILRGSQNLSIIVIH